MKKLLTILTVTILSLGAYAQGKVSFQNDSLHLVYWNPNPLFSPPGMAGLAVNADTAPGFQPMADFYMGTSSSTLYLYTSTTFRDLTAGPGKWNAASVPALANPTTGAPFIPGGTTVFVEIQIRDSTFIPANTFNFSSFPVGLTGPWGASQEFTFTLGPSIVYPVLWGPNGTWPPGTFNMDQYGVGSRGAIMFGYIPEPSSLALIGLGAAMMLNRRIRGTRGKTVMKK